MPTQPTINEEELELDDFAAADKAEEPAPAAPVVEEQAAPVAALPTLGDVELTNKLQLSKKANLMLKELVNQPKVRIVIPRQHGEVGTCYYEGNINQLPFRVLKDIYVEVPKQIADNVAETYKIESYLGSRHPLNMENKNAAAIGQALNS